jgi:hypothetical protein
MGQSAQNQIVSVEAFWTFSAAAFSLRASKAWLDDADDAISDLILRSKTSSTEPSYLSTHRCVPVSVSTSCAVYRAGAAASEFLSHPADLNFPARSEVIK